MNKLNIKTKEEIKIMQEGGKKLSHVKKKLYEAAVEGISSYEIERMANDLLRRVGVSASFKMVPGYSWATCVNVNDGVVHGIPKKDVVFKKGDIVSVDIGAFYRGFHTDTAFTKLIGENAELDDFLAAGKEVLRGAIRKVLSGLKVYDISLAIESGLWEYKLTPVKALTGHGVGRALHERPAIACFVSKSSDSDVVLKPGMVLAIEVMYSEGSGEIVLEEDGWTISTKDGKIAALFEESVAVTDRGPLVLTNSR